MVQFKSGNNPKEPKRISGAPPPITPVRGSYSPAKPKEPDVRKPDWRFWTKINAVKVWQAVALSLDIDPDGMKQSAHAWMAGPGADPIFQGHSFPSEATKVEYGKRLRLVKPEITNPAIFYLHTIIAGDRARCEIYLKDFATWAIFINLGDMPSELVAMAQKPGKLQSQVAPAESKAQGAANARSNRPLRQQPFQESEILQVISELQYTATSLPKNIPGKPGVKAAVRSRVNYSVTVFNKAWERLAANREIGYAPK